METASLHLYPAPNPDSYLAHHQTHAVHSSETLNEAAHIRLLIGGISLIYFSALQYFLVWMRLIWSLPDKSADDEQFLEIENSRRLALEICVH